MQIQIQPAIAEIHMCGIQSIRCVRNHRFPIAEQMVIAIQQLRVNQMHLAF